MKLRNKKTGEIISEIDVSQDHESIWVLENKPRVYHTLADLNAEWEDYKPAEPLIEDDCARKAVYLWASALQIHQVRCTITTKGLGVEVATFKACELHSAPRIEFAVLDADIANGETYTIAELCGEEEEWVLI